MSPGADALNEATVLARLGAKVRLLTVMGSDPAGNYLLMRSKERFRRLKSRLFPGKQHRLLVVWQQVINIGKCLRHRLVYRHIGYRKKVI